jgi:hypothetical protein
MPNDISFIRQLIDFIDQKLAAQEVASGDTATTAVPTSAEPQVDTEDTPEKSQAGVNPMDRDDIFVPPLQAKLEIMKKLSGIPLKDETLSQSQAQGGPNKRTNNSNETPANNDQARSESQVDILKKNLTMSDMFGNDVEITGD